MATATFSVTESESGPKCSVLATAIALELPPISPFFVVKPTLSAGNGVFALQRLPASAPLLNTSYVPMYTINRVYRREVCGYCFVYDGGRNLPIRNPSIGFSYCSEKCREAWEADNKLAIADVWEPLEAFTIKRHGKSSELEQLPNADNGRPPPVEISKAWNQCMAKLATIQPGVPPATKAARRARDAAIKMAVHPDTLSFLASGHLALSGRAITGADAFEAHLGQLAQTDTPYQTPHDLELHTTAHLQLSVLLNLRSLAHRDYATQLSNCLTATAASNAFALRPPIEQDPDRSEYFGWGLWPEASYFNHSCEPNVEKERIGREWRFRTAQEVREGDELCISYLGGDEADMEREERQERLKGGWGFDCRCTRCQREA